MIGIIFIDAVMRSFCSECKKPNIHCKGMCSACYQRMQRNTEKGKERMKAYNANAGKESQRKYREKKRLEKPPRTPKGNCECGKPSVSKNLCMTCYHRFYYRKKNGWKQGSRKTKINSDVLFNCVLNFVKKGYTILDACKKAGYKSSSTLYNLISPLQRKELISFKIIGAIDDDDEF